MQVAGQLPEPVNGQCAVKNAANSQNNLTVSEFDKRLFDVS